MNTSVIYIDNLKCAGCERSIEKKLLQDQSVQAIKINIENGSVEIVHDDMTNQKQLATLLESMGYPERGTSTLLQKGQSYVSCMIGKVDKSLHPDVDHQS